MTDLWHTSRKTFVRSILFALTLVTVSSCASPLPPPFQSADVSPRLVADQFISVDGAKLPMHSWSSSSGTPKAIVVGVHGMNDYGNAFAMPGAWFAERDIAVYAYDQRGFGAAPGRGRWAGSDAMIADLNAFITAVQRDNPTLPVFVVGLSMGAAVVLAAADAGKLPQVDGVVLVAPAVWGWQAMNPLYKITLWITAHTWPSKILTGGRLKIWPSDNIDMLRAYSRDPLVIKETRVDAIYGLVTLMDEGYAGAEALKTPTLVLYGQKDEIVPPRPVNDVAGRIAGPSRFVIYDDGYHMLLRDLQRETVWEDILIWTAALDAPFPSVASRAAPVAREIAAPAN